MRDVRFWIFLFFLVRLIGITYPPIEVGHNWRQTTGTMVARNFYEVHANPYYPQIDFGGENLGITAMEFPLLNYLMYLVSCVFGYDHWYGRLINLVITSLGLFYFYRLLKILFDQPLAFASTLLLTTSIWFQFGRKIMPDTFAVSLLLMSFYHVVVFLKSASFQWWRILTAGLLFMSGAMSKLPAVIPFFALPLLFFRWPDKSRWIALVMVFAMASLPVLHWYFIWTDHLTSTYGMHHFFMGKNMATAVQETSQHAALTAHRVFIGPLKYIGGVVFLLSTVWALYKRQTKVLAILGTTSFALVLVIFKSGETFYAHDYYIIPFVPVFALIIAHALSQLSKRLNITLIAIICIESLLNQYHDLRWKPTYYAFVELESIMDKHTNRKDKIAVNCAPNPTALYFSHRKGWLSTNANLLRPSYLDSLQQLGLQHVLICKTRFGTVIEVPNTHLLYEDMHFRLYLLKPL